MKMRKVLMILFVAVAVGVTGCKIGSAPSDPSSSGEDAIVESSSTSRDETESTTRGTDPLSEFLRQRPVITEDVDPGFRGESTDDEPLEDLEPGVLVIGESEVVIDWDEDSPILT